MLILGTVDDDAAERIQERIGRAVSAADARRVVVTVARAGPGLPRPYRARVRLEVDGHTVAAEAAADTRTGSIDALANRLARELSHVTGREEEIDDDSIPVGSSGVRRGSVGVGAARAGDRRTAQAVRRDTGR